jgi:uncharacterized protein
MIAALFIAMAVGGSAPAATPNPGFDCTRATGQAEELVCTDAQLSMLDRETSRLYALASHSAQLDTKRRARLRAYQIGWIRGRNDCWKAADLRACVLGSYVTRIHELRRDYPAARGADADGISSGPVGVACEGADQPLAATFIRTDPPLARLESQDRRYIMTLTPTASGARYVTGTHEGEVSLWTKGDAALLQLPGQAAIHCTIGAPR